MYPTTPAAAAAVRNNSLSKLFQRGISAVAMLSMGLMASPVMAQDLLISGVMDGPLSGGLPKVVELYVVNNIPDLSVCGLGSANNGGGVLCWRFSSLWNNITSENIEFTSRDLWGA